MYKSDGPVRLRDRCGSAMGFSLRYKARGILVKPTSPYSNEIAAKGPCGALDTARVSRGALSLFDSKVCPLFPHLGASSALSHL